VHRVGVRVAGAALAYCARIVAEEVDGHVVGSSVLVEPTLNGQRAAVKPEMQAARSIAIFLGAWAPQKLGRLRQRPQRIRV
jgi:hypothetical protein